MSYSPTGGGSLGIWVLVLCVCMFWIYQSKENEHRSDFENIKALASVDQSSMRAEEVVRLSKDYLKKYPDRTERSSVQQWQAIARSEINRRGIEELYRKQEQERLRVEKEEEKRKAEQAEQSFAEYDDGAYSAPNRNEHDRPTENRRDEAIKVEQEKRKQWLASQPPYLRDADARVTAMIRGGVLKNASFVDCLMQNVPRQQEPAGGYPSTMYVASPSRGIVRATSETMPSYDKRVHVVYDFTYVSVGGFVNNRRGWLVYSRDTRSGRWVFNETLSTIDHMPKSSW